MLRWVIKDQLAGGPRPRNKKQPKSQVSTLIVDAWLKKAKSSFGIRSIICLLDDGQLRLYESLRMNLVSYYKASGFQVVHIPVRNYQHPALSDSQLKRFGKRGGSWKSPC